MIKGQGNRLKEVRLKFNIKNQRIAAESIGETQQTWSNWEREIVNIPADKAKKIADKYDINLSWILTGDGPMTDYPMESVTRRQRPIKIINHSVLAGLSSGEEIPDSEVVGEIYMSLIQDKVLYFAIKVSGRSMEPGIKEGSTVIITEMIDKADFQDEKPYVVIVNGIPFIKRVNMILGGEDKNKFCLSSDNEQQSQLVDSSDIQKWYRIEYVVNPV